MDVRDVWQGTSIGPRLLRFLLLPASGLYWLGWKVYLLMYRMGFKKSARPHSPVVVIGNFTVGGTGKSPTVIHLFDVLRTLGYEVVIGCSGYGAPRSESATLAPEGALDPVEWGDEPAMLRMVRPDASLVVGRDRVQAATLVRAHAPNSVLLMDDGLQHLPLQTDVRIALDSRSLNRLVLPAGPYREPYDSARIDLMLGDALQLHFSPLEFVRPDGSAVTPRPDQEVDALTAIGDPDRFFSDLESVGLRLRNKIALPDHAPMTDGRLVGLLRADAPIVTTEKDWVKLRSRQDLEHLEFWLARRTVLIEPAAQFAQWIDEKVKESLRPQG